MLFDRDNALEALGRVLIKKGIITEQEILRKIEEVRAERLCLKSVGVKCEKCGYVHGKWETYVDVAGIKLCQKCYEESEKIGKKAI